MEYDTRLDSFLRFIEFEKRYSKHTLSSYKTDLIQFSRYIQSTFEVIHFSDVNHSMARSWVVSLMEEGNNARSVSRKVASLKALFKFLTRNRVVKKNPTVNLKAPKIKKSLPAFVGEQDLVKLLDMFEYPKGFEGLRDKLVIELLYGTGIRLSELIDLKHTMINDSQQVIKVKGKGNKERVIPVNKSLVALIETYKRTKSENEFTSEYLITTDKDKKSYPMLIYRIVKKYLSMVTTEDKKSPHVLRHTFATHLLNKGADLNAIKDLLGHASLAATQVYTHNSTEKIKEAFKQAHPKA